MPSKFDFGSNNTIEILYDAAGQKLRKTVKTANVVTLTQDYLAGIELKNNRLEAIYNEEGRAYNSTNTTQTYPYTWRRECNLKDHLGNTRVSFCDLNNNGLIENQTEILNETHYYPFGLSFSGAWYANNAQNKNRYLYNGKELNEDFGLNLSDYGARWYDAALGRWLAPDPLAEQYRRWSPYNYTVNNPIRFIDPDGRGVTNSDWIPTIHFDKDKNGNNTNAYLVLQAEKGDNAQTLSDALGIPLANAEKIYNQNFNANTGGLGLPEGLNGAINTINNAIYNAYVSNKDEYNGTFDKNYSCYESALAINENRFPGDYKDKRSGIINKDEYVKRINEGHNETSIPKIGTIASFKFQNPIGGDFQTPHAASYIIESQNRTKYFWSKNGNSNTPVIATEKELHELYRTNIVKYFK